MSTKMETCVDQEDFWEELSNDSASLTSPKVAIIRSSFSSGVGSSVSDSLTNNSEAPFERAVYVDTTTDLPPSLPKGSPWRIAGGAFLMFLSIVSFVITPYDLLMSERLRMLPGFPPYDWWVQPPDEVLLKVYIFNVTNSVDFLNGNASQLAMEQIGPFVYQEKLIHTDIVFNENGTMSYTAHRSAVFLPHLSNISRNATIIVPNLAILGGASYLSDASFITKMGFNMMVRRVGSSPLTRISAEEYMWNWTDPLIGVAKTFVPSMVPVENMGILQRIYSDFVDRVTVHIGTKNPRDFFLIDKFHGSDRLGYWEGEKCDSCQGSTEGVTYPQFLTRNDSIHYLRKTICRVAHLNYARDVLQENMQAYRWELPHNSFHRPSDGSEDCFTRPGELPLPSGISDVSPCYYQFPIAISLPHFLGAVPNVEPKVTGMTPDGDSHGSYVIIEPLTGIPMESRARSQSNLVVKPLYGFSPQIMRFSNMILPMFWLEYGQQGLPWYVSSLMYFTVVVLPACQHWVSLAILLIGFTLFAMGFAPYALYIFHKLPFKYHKFEKLSFGYFRMLHCLMQSPAF